MIEGNLRMVVAVAKKYAFPISLIDLIREGSIGLNRAVKVDHTRGYKFSTYAIGGSVRYDAGH